MTVYNLARATYRWCDRQLFRHLPKAWDHRLRSLMFPVARRLFRDRIKARSAGEFSATASSRKADPARLPAWAEAEVAALAELEPALSGLVGESASLERYFIPWDLNYVGRRYAAVRRQLTNNYACIILTAASADIDVKTLRAAGQPLVIIDVDGVAGAEQQARAVGAQYIAMRAEQLDMNDHSALLARLVLQLAPEQVGIARHPLLDHLVERHGVAMASVSTLTRYGMPPPATTKLI